MGGEGEPAYAKPLEWVGVRQQFNKPNWPNEHQSWKVVQTSPFKEVKTVTGSIRGMIKAIGFAGVACG